MKNLETLHNENLKMLLKQKTILVYGITLIITILIGLLNVSKIYLYQENMGISDGTEWKFFIEDTKLSNASISAIIEKYIDTNVSGKNTIDIQDQFIVEKIKKIYGENWNTADNAKKKFFDERAKLIKARQPTANSSLQSLKDGYVEGWKVLDTLIPKILYVMWGFILLIFTPLFHRKRNSGFYEIIIGTRYGRSQINIVNWINAYEIVTGMFVFGLALLYLFVWSRYGLDGYHLKIQTIPKYFLTPTSWNLSKAFLLQALIAYLTTLILLNVSLIISLISKSVKIAYGIIVLIGVWQFFLLQLFENSDKVVFIKYLLSEVFKIENLIMGRSLIAYAILLLLISIGLILGLINKVKKNEYV